MFTDTNTSYYSVYTAEYSDTIKNAKRAERFPDHRVSSFLGRTNMIGIEKLGLVVESAMTPGASCSGGCESRGCCLCTMLVGACYGGWFINVRFSSCRCYFFEASVLSRIEALTTRGVG